MPPRASPVVLLGFLVAVVLLGLNFVGVRVSNRELEPLWGAAARFAIASLLMAGLVLAMRVPMPRGRMLLAGMLYGGLAFGLTYALAYVGMLHVPAGMAAVLFATIPLMTVVGASALRMEPWRWNGLAGSLLALGGVGLVFRDQLGQAVPLGAMLLVLLGAGTGAASFLLVKRVGGHPLSFNAIGMSTGTLLLLAASAMAGEAWRLPTVAATQVAVAYLVLSSVLAFVLLLWVLRTWTVSAASYQAVLSPLVTVAAGAVLLQERVTTAFAAGAVLVLAGVMLAAWKGGPRAVRQGTPPAGPHRS